MTFWLHYSLSHSRASSASWELVCRAPVADSNPRPLCLIVLHYVQLLYTKANSAERQLPSVLPRLQDSTFYCTCSRGLLLGSATTIANGHSEVRARLDRKRKAGQYWTRTQQGRLRDMQSPARSMAQNGSGPELVTAQNGHRPELAIGPKGTTGTSARDCC